MKRIYVNEKWCLGCHLCEYYCAFANSGKSDMVKALKNIRIHPRIHIEEGANGVHFAVNCRHCADPLCVKGCISGALTIVDGAVQIDLCIAEVFKRGLFQPQRRLVHRKCAGTDGLQRGPQFLVHPRTSRSSSTAG